MLKIPYQKDLELPSEPSGKIDTYLWMDNGCEPEAAFYVCYNETALRVRLTAAIKEPIVYALKDDGNVWEDNCLEFFFAPYAGVGDPDYLNFECNSLGYMVIGKGPARDGRESVVDWLKPKMDVYTVIRPGKGVEINYTIPFAALQELFGKDAPLKKGDRVRMNFYACGEKTPQMYFGMWSKIESASPDFHLPQFFGEGVLD